MTENELIQMLHDRSAHLHPGWQSFCRLMQDKQYGWDACSAAWHFFKDGWDACGDSRKR